MKVQLIHNTPLMIIDEAISMTHDKPSKNVEHAKERMYRVANKLKHGSVVEHVSYTFKILGIPRYILMELTRHRIASYTVKSSRYTLSELKNIPAFEGKNYGKAKNFIHLTGNTSVDVRSIAALNALQEVVKRGTSNDFTKACMPECYLTDLVITINMRSLQNLLKLRTNRSAHVDIRELAHTLFETVPESHKFMLAEFCANTKEIKNENNS